VEIGKRPICPIDTDQCTHRGAIGSCSGCGLSAIRKLRGSGSIGIKSHLWQCRRCQALFGRTATCTPKSAPFRSRWRFCHTNQGPLV